MNSEALKQQVAQRKKEIHADSYPMSIGEVINLYRDGELEIHPEFQRFFRWTAQQKTNLIESILLGIPIPSFFVSQRDDGVWEVVDGLQRLSTIFEFVGVLKNSKDEDVLPLQLLSAKYLTHLQDATWKEIDKSLQIDFKREKIDFKIIKKESTQDTKYELFQRLNTGGASLSNQEVRNCILIMLNREFYEWFEKLASNKDFQDCVQLSFNQMAQRYDLELVTRFIVFQNMENKYSGEEINNFLTEKISTLANTESFDCDELQTLFENVFSILNIALSDDVFRKYDSKKGKYIGPFSLTRFEAITYGLGKNIHSYNKNSDIEVIKEKIQELCNDDVFIRNSGKGTNAQTRLSKILPLAKDIFTK